MNSCKECIVDMVCIKECPMFEVDLDRLKTDEELYLKRCMNNIEDKTYKISKNVIVKIRDRVIYWFKDGEEHRDNDQPSLITYRGTKFWYKDGKEHRDNDQPAIIFYTGVQKWYKNGVEYEPM